MLILTRATRAATSVSRSGSQNGSHLGKVRLYRAIIPVIRGYYRYGVKDFLEPRQGGVQLIQLLILMTDKRPSRFVTDTTALLNYMCSRTAGLTDLIFTPMKALGPSNQREHR